MNSFACRIGGKKSSRGTILPRFPPDYDRYVEVFGGAGWIFFAEERKGIFEVLNDFDGDIANLYYCVQNQNDELIEKLEFVINSRTLFDLTAKSFKTSEKTAIGDVRRAADFYVLMRQSFGNNCKSFGCKNSPMWSKFPVILEAGKRLDGVVIENKDFEKVINQYDSENAFIYCDPPYYGTESYYSVGFSENDHLRLKENLMKIKGKFMISYGDCEFIRELYDGQNLFFHAYERPDSLKNVNCGGDNKFKEILIANYDMEQSFVSKKPIQISLFDFSEQ